MPAGGQVTHQGGALGAPVAIQGTPSVRPSSTLGQPKPVVAWRPVIAWPQCSIQQLSVLTPAALCLWWCVWWEFSPL